jgi:glycosyltransferase involved in cell wall biosynthesis
VPLGRFSVSVIIPVYNGAAFLADAVASVRRQKVFPREIIIIDDGSTDETSSMAANLGKDIRYFYQKNRGPHAAQNTGLQAARGDVIAFLDADDQWPDDKLSLQLPLLAESPELDIVLGCLQYVRCLKTPTDEWRDIPFLKPFFGSSCFGAALFRARAFAKVGPLDPSLRQGGDVDWFLRAREQGLAMAAVDRVTLYYRLHQHNLTRDHFQRDHYLLQALKKSLNRRRQANGKTIVNLPDLPRPIPAAGAAPAGKRKS